jgi:hypothetical protein
MLLAIKEALDRNRIMYQQAHQQHDASLAEIDIHAECRNQCRSSIILTCIDQHPESLVKLDERGDLPLHILLNNKSSSIDIALMMIGTYPAALQHRNNIRDLPLHIECRYQCRSSIISRFIELYPEALAIADGRGYLPLHSLIQSKSSSVADDSMMIEKYPAALRYQTKLGYLPLHWQLYQSSSVEDALMVIEKYPAALRHQTKRGYLPLHIECYTQCRSAIISKCIELYPEGLAVAIEGTLRLPLHLLVLNKLSMIDDALTMIEKYPAALQHRDKGGDLPLRYECMSQCRPSIIMRCIELYPESVDDDIICLIFDKINRHNFHGSGYRSVVRMVVTIRPMSLYRRRASKINDIRTNPDYRRRILNLLPHHVFTPRHESDYQDLNWSPREAMMMLLSQIQRLSRQWSDVGILVNSCLDMRYRDLPESSFDDDVNTWRDLLLHVLDLLRQAFVFSRILEQADDSISSNNNWDQQRCLLLRVIKISTIMSKLDANVGIAMSSDASYGICQHEDLGDILLRTILGFL